MNRMSKIPESPTVWFTATGILLFISGIGLNLMEALHVENNPLVIQAHDITFVFALSHCFIATSVLLLLSALIYRLFPILSKPPRNWWFAAPHLLLFVIGFICLVSATSAYWLVLLLSASAFILGTLTFVLNGITRIIQWLQHSK